MEAPILSIKVKGLEGLQTLTVKGSGLAGVKLKGIGLLGARGAELESVRLGAAKAAQGARATGLELEGVKFLTTGKGVVVKAAEIERGCTIIAVKGGAIPGQAAAGAAAAKGATAVKLKVAGGAAKGALASSGATGTIWSGTGLSLGLGLGLGAWGPLLLLGTAGLVATGIYLYRRNRQLEAEDLAEEGLGGTAFSD